MWERSSHCVLICARSAVRRMAAGAPVVICSALVWDVPCEMKVAGGLHDSGSRGEVGVPALHAHLREHVALHAEALAVEEEFDRVTVGEADDGNDLAFTSGPVPVRREVQHGDFSPEALVEVEAVLGEAAGIDDAGTRGLGGPARFAEVVDAGPHEVAADVVVDLGKALQLLDLDALVGGGTKLVGRGAAAGDEAGHGAVLRADEAAPREVVAIDAVELFTAVAPAANVVVSHHVEFGEELGQRAVGLGNNLVAGHGDQSSRVVVVQDFI